MRSTLAGLALLSVIAFPAPVGAQSQPYKVAFDLTSADPTAQQAVMRWIREVSSVNPKNEMEVVMYAKGLELVVKDKAKFAAEIAEAIKSSHVSFKVCAIAMKNQNIDKSQLLPNVEIVPDGIGELVAKQRVGWGYIKAAP